MILSQVSKVFFFRSLLITLSFLLAYPYPIYANPPTPSEEDSIDSEISNTTRSLQNLLTQLPSLVSNQKQEIEALANNKENKQFEGFRAKITDDFSLEFRLSAHVLQNKQNSQNKSRILLNLQCSSIEKQRQENPKTLVAQTVLPIDIREITTFEEAKNFQQSLTSLIPDTISAFKTQIPNTIARRMNSQTQGYFPQNQQQQKVSFLDSIFHSIFAIQSAHANQGILTRIRDFLDGGIMQVITVPLIILCLVYCFRNPPAAFSRVFKGSILFIGAFVISREIARYINRAPTTSGLRSELQNVANDLRSVQQRVIQLQQSLP